MKINAKVRLNATTEDPTQLGSTLWKIISLSKILGTSKTTKLINPMRDFANFMSLMLRDASDDVITQNGNVILIPCEHETSAMEAVDWYERSIYKNKLKGLVDVEYLKHGNLATVSVTLLED